MSTVMIVMMILTKWITLIGKQLIIIPQFLKGVDVGYCQIMPTLRECVCCYQKFSELPAPVSCITLHPGFHIVCLDVWVLQTAYFCHQQYG